MVGPSWRRPGPSFICAYWDVWTGRDIIRFHQKCGCFPIGFPFILDDSGVIVEWSIFQWDIYTDLALYTVKQKRILAFSLYDKRWVLYALVVIMPCALLNRHFRRSCIVNRTNWLNGTRLVIWWHPWTITLPFHSSWVWHKISWLGTKRGPFFTLLKSIFEHTVSTFVENTWLPKTCKQTTLISDP